MHPQSAMSDVNTFGQALVEYISRSANVSRLHRALYETTSYSNWQNGSFDRLIKTTAEFYNMLVAGEGHDPNYAFGRAIQVCCEAAMAVAVSRSPLIQQLMPEEVTIYNQASGVAKAAQEDMERFAAATAQPAYNSGRSSLYARSSTPTVAPGYQPTYQPQGTHMAPTTAPIVTRRPIGNFTPGYTGQPQAPAATKTASQNRAELYRKAKQPEPVIASNNTNPRYERSRDALPPAVVTTVPDDVLIDALSIKEMSKMKYDTHRLAPITVAKVTDRTQRNLDDFLGVLASETRVVADHSTLSSDEVTNNVIGLSDTFAACGLDMAILKAKGMLRNALLTSERTIVEFEYTNVRSIYYGDANVIAAAIVGCPQITRLRDCRSYESAHEVFADYITNRPTSKDVYSVPDRIMAEINTRLTEAVNRTLMFALAVDISIDDFAQDWPDLIKMLNDKYTDFEDDLNCNVSQVIDRCISVGMLDTTSDDFVKLDQFMDGALSDSICVMDTTAVTLLPLMSTELDLAVTKSYSLVSYKTLPRLYDALNGIMERLEFSHMFYSRIYMATEDGVLIEVIQTTIPCDEDVDERTKLAIRVVDRS